ncbi:MAG: DUF1844 domain-containing protein [Proteobacteria bacterium]|nr:DUF1844 domain-containing protein [Pseudomonadota bacterium]
MEEETKGKGFVIKDRRHFDESGDLREEEAPKVGETKTEVKVEEAGSTPEGTAASDADATPLPEINFASFIFSLSTTAMYHFGDFPDPVTNEIQRNLTAAKQTIDLLSILEAKTEGNLTADEKQLLQGILYELRMRFVKEKTKK